MHGEKSYKYETCVVPSRWGDELFGHKWVPLDKEPRSLIVIFHGFGAHGAYPTVLFVAEFLASQGHVVLSADMHGHGRSPGQKAYIGDPSQMTGDGNCLIN